MVKTQDGQAGPVEGGGAGVHIGVDASASSGSGSPSSPGSSHEVGDLAFHDRPVGSVGGLPLWGFLLGAGLLEERLLGVDGDGPAPPGRSAEVAKRAVGAVRFEAGLALTAGREADRSAMAGGAGDPIGVKVNVEVLLGVAAGGVAHRRALGAQVVAFLGHVSSGGAIGISRVADHYWLVGPVLEVADQILHRVTVGRVGRGGGHLVDDLRVGVDRNVGLVAVEAAVGDLCPWRASGSTVEITRSWATRRTQS